MLYYDLFSFMESENILNPIDDIHLFCLHYVYVPRINESLDAFL